MAHFGNPWCDTAAEVVWKNENVWADLSAFWIGDAQKFDRDTGTGTLARQVERVRHWIEHTEKPDRFLFGSDWPLVTFAAYRDFVRRLMTEAEHAKLFHDNAKALFKL